MDGSEPLSMPSSRAGDAAPPRSWSLLLRLVLAWLPLAALVLAWHFLQMAPVTLTLGSRSPGGSQSTGESAPQAGPRPDPKNGAHGESKESRGFVALAPIEPFGEARSRLRWVYDLSGDGDTARSNLRLFENGAELGPAHQSDEAVKSLGAGRFSHRGRALLFSASDGSDPSRNGRVYTIRWQPTVRWQVQLLAALLGIAALAVGTRGTLRTARRVMSAAATRRLGLTLLFSVLAIPAAWLLRPTAAAALAEIGPPVILAFCVIAGVLLGLVRFTGTRRARRVRRVDAWASRLTAVWLLPALVLLVTSTLAAARAGTIDRQLPGSGFGLFATIELSDSLGYESGARSLQSHAKLDEFSSRRPLVPAAHAMLLEVGASSIAALSLQSLALAGGIAALGVTLLRRAGPWCAVATAMATLAWTQGYLAVTMSEALATAIGAASLAWLLAAGRPARIVPLTTACFGISVMTLLRPGAIFAPPLLVACAPLLVSRGQRLRAFISCLVSAMAAWALNAALLAAVGPPGGSNNAQASNTFLGLAAGTDWAAAEETYAKDLSELATEKDRAAWRYSKAWELIRSEPSRFAGSLWRGESEGVRRIPMETLTDSRVTGATMRGVPGLTFGFEIAWLVGIVVGAVTLLRRRPGAGIAVWTAALLLSLPLVWIDGSLRALAGTFPLFALIMALPAWMGRGRPGSAGLPPAAALGSSIIIAIVPAAAIGAIAMAQLGSHEARDDRAVTNASLATGEFAAHWMRRVGAPMLLCADDSEESAAAIARLREEASASPNPDLVVVSRAELAAALHPSMRALMPAIAAQGHLCVIAEVVNESTGFRGAVLMPAEAARGAPGPYDLVLTPLGIKEGNWENWAIAKAVRASPSVTRGGNQ